MLISCTLLRIKTNSLKYLGKNLSDNCILTIIEELEA